MSASRAAAGPLRFSPPPMLGLRLAAYALPGQASNGLFGHREEQVRPDLE